MHTLILGQTGSGKSTLLKVLAGHYRRSGIPVVAYTSVVGDFAGHADEVHHDVDVFLQRVFQARRCAIFVDESGEVTNSTRIRETAPLATRSRHLGHVVHFSAQRAQGLIGPIVRDQCTRLYLFNTSWDDASLMARSWTRDAEGRALLESAPSFAQGEYVHVKRFPYTIERRRLDLPQLYGRVA